jgi:hypothetical protein
MPDERGSFRRVIARQIGEGKPVFEKSGRAGVDVAAQTPVRGPAKMFENGLKRAVLGSFLAAFWRKNRGHGTENIEQRSGDRGQGIGNRE